MEAVSGWFLDVLKMLSPLFPRLTVRGDGQLDFDEFCVAFHTIFQDNGKAAEVCACGDLSVFHACCARHVCHFWCQPDRVSRLTGRQQHSLFAAEKEAMTDEYNKLEAKHNELLKDYDMLQHNFERSVRAQSGLGSTASNKPVS
jgi:hypothetical protein